MKTVILCGGLGTRLSEETHLKPKPMVTVGNYPILWHIMKIYDSFGFKDFVLPLGYKGDAIKEFFLNFYTMNSDFRVNLAEGKVEHLNQSACDWQVELIDTGLETLTGGRLHRLEQSLREHGTFALTYGDGVADVDLASAYDFHKTHGKVATMTAVRPPARFGTMNFDGDRVTEFKEKPQTGEGWINGGFFFFEPQIFDYLSGDQTILEAEPLERLAADGQLMAYKHQGFWQCMDTIRDRKLLEAYWASSDAPWKRW